MTPAAQASGIQRTIEDAWERRTTLTGEETDDLVRPAVEAAMQGLESGDLRVAEPKPGGGWQVNEWLKKAVLLYFRVNDMAVVEAQPAPYWDKVEARFAGFDHTQPADHAQERRQAFALPRPGLVAEGEHRGEIDQEVCRQHYREPRRIVRRGIDQLEPGETEELGDRRPVAEPGR